MVSTLTPEPKDNQTQKSLKQNIKRSWCPQSGWTCRMTSSDYYLLHCSLVADDYRLQARGYYTRLLYLVVGEPTN